MLRRNKKEIQSTGNQLRISENTAPGLFSRSMGVLKRIARTFALSEKPVAVIPPKEPEKPFAIVPLKAPEKRAERPAFPARCIVFSDTDNDVNSVKNTLRFAGILNEKGELTGNLEGISIFHTGDLIDKKNPDPSVVEYWQLLQQNALTKGCHVKLIVGNHEQEIWQKIRAGEKCGMGAKQAHRLNDFIEDLDLFHVAGPVLFIHGYPTLEFLQTLLHFKEVTGKDLNCFNTDHYKKAFRSVNAMRQYAYVRANRQAHYLLYDVADASRYYKKQGRVVGAVLEQLKIGIVVHGHRPQHSGVQVDYEFAKWIPKVRMIGNDTMVRRKGIGATVIRATSSGALDIIFINKKTKSNKLRRKVRQELREPLVSSSASRLTSLETADIKSAAQG
ncbi:MAG: metallophosphoesterase [Pseudomonadota bacterium]|nr:metallophosphoesterase [Pseudomonadota bacterium]